MAKLTWLGSTEGYREGETPLDSCTWNGVLFTAGDKVEITDEWMINKAKGNRFFRVEESPSANGGKPPDPVLPGGVPYPETWTNDPLPHEPFEKPSGGRERPLPRYPDTPPDYPPEDEPAREPKKRGGRPKRIRENGDEHS